MIDLLGVGIPDGMGGWWIRHLSARLPGGAVVAVLARRAEERRAVLDGLVGRRVPAEGRIWVCGVPVARASRRRLQKLVAEVRLDAMLAENRSVIWNTLAGTGLRRAVLGGLLRFPRPARRQAATRALAGVGLAGLGTDPVGLLDRQERARVVIARTLVRCPEVVLVPEIDEVLDLGDAAGVLESLRHLAGSQRTTVVASLASMALACEYTDRLLVIANGALIFQGPPAGLGTERTPAIEAFIGARR